MDKIIKPSAINQEVEWDKSETIISKTDEFGTIVYCNEVFCNVSGYEEEELMNLSHNIIRHPDMPKVIFKWLWDNLKEEKNIILVMKNLSKSGKFYWVYAKFTILKDEKGKNYYFSSRKTISNNVIEVIEPLYQKILEIEQKESIEASELFFIQYLKNNNTNYNDFINKILN